MAVKEVDEDSPRRDVDVGWKGSGRVCGCEGGRWRWEVVDGWAEVYRDRRFPA